MRKHYGFIITAVAALAFFAPAAAVAKIQPPQVCGSTGQDCGSGVQCGSITVPSDWSEPGSAPIAIGLGRLPARDPQRYRPGCAGGGSSATWS